MIELSLEGFSLDVLLMYGFLPLGLLLLLFPSQTICAVKSFFPVFEGAVNPKAITVIWFCRLYGLILTSIAVFDMAEVYSVRKVW
jgi:hypothetical protein